MHLSTLCYLEQGETYLMMYRNKKTNDNNQGKWIGIGGKFQEGETPEECMLREVKEETGYTLTRYFYRGLVTFVQDGQETEYMHLFTADRWKGTPIECTEGTLAWVNKKDVFQLNLWEGDRIFFRLLEERQNYFSLKLRYMGEKLTEAICYPTQEEILDQKDCSVVSDFRK